MSDITGNGNVIMAAEPEQLRKEFCSYRSGMEGLDVQLSPPFAGWGRRHSQCPSNSLRDRILEAAGRSKETS